MLLIELNLKEGDEVKLIKAVDLGTWAWGDGDDDIVEEHYNNLNVMGIGEDYWNQLDGEWEVNGEPAGVTQVAEEVVVPSLGEKTFGGGYKVTFDDTYKEVEEVTDTILKSALEVQVGGDHYRKGTIQPIEFIMANNLSFPQGSVVKYVTRYKDKGGVEDLEKAKHYIDFMIEEHKKELN